MRLSTGDTAPAQTAANARAGEGANGLLAIRCITQMREHCSESNGKSVRSLMTGTDHMVCARSDNGQEQPAVPRIEYAKRRMGDGAPSRQVL